jgi:hypothetical protein
VSYANPNHFKVLVATFQFQDLYPPYKQNPKKLSNLSLSSLVYGVACELLNVDAHSTTGMPRSKSVALEGRLVSSTVLYGPFVVIGYFLGLPTTSIDNHLPATQREE